MRRPYWREQSGTWVVKQPGGRLKTLGKDPHGAKRKHPPKKIVDAWHTLERQTNPKPENMLFAEVAGKYIEYLTNPKTKQTAREHLDWFKAFVGNRKVSDLRVHHVNEYLKTKASWSDSTKATAINRITSALSHAVTEGHIADHHVKFAAQARNRNTRGARRFRPTPSRESWRMPPIPN